MFEMLNTQRFWSQKRRELQRTAEKRRELQRSAEKRERTKKTSKLKKVRDYYKKIFDSNISKTKK